MAKCVGFWCHWCLPIPPRGSSSQGSWTCTESISACLELREEGENNLAAAVRPKDKIQGDRL